MPGLAAFLAGLAARQLVAADFIVQKVDVDPSLGFLDQADF